MRELTLQEKFQCEFLDVDPRTAEIVNPFANRTRRDVEEPHFHLLRVMRDPKYAYFTCKALMNGPGGKPLTLFPFQAAIIRELWYRPLPMLIANRGGGKSYLLGLYALLRATFIQGRKIVIVGSGFRQAKGVFQVAETIWYNSPVLRSLFSDSPQSGPKHDSDRWILRLGDSTITALPLGDGTAIRGERAHDLLTDEFASIPWEIYETSVKPFTAVEMDPMAAAMRRAEIRVLQKEGAWTDEMVEHERTSRVANQSVIAGTSYYQFNHFFDYWKRWKTIIESQGDRSKLEAAFPSGVAANIDYRDYSIIRIPYRLLPEGFLSETIINDAAATYNTSVFMNEYESCVLPDEPVMTDAGAKPMIDVQPGDMVLTHKGRFRPVTGKTCRPAPEIIRYRTLGYGRDIHVTPEHPFWQGGELWGTLGDETKLANLNDLSGTDRLDITLIVRDYFERDDGKIYARAGNSKLSRDQVNHIHRHDGPMPRLAREMDLPLSTVYRVRYARRRGVHAIPPQIDLDYHFGLIVGYYASEGSIGADGRLVDFALDGHVGVELKKYVGQLSSALEHTFGVTPKVYPTSNNVAKVDVTNSLVADVMSWVCPGVCSTKFVRPEVIWSNTEFIHGFLEGYWNGDGHLPRNYRTTPLASTNSLSLASQVKMACSFFGISATIGYRPKRAMIIRGQSYTSDPRYTITLTGEHGRLFRNWIYDESEPPGTRRQQITNDCVCSTHPVVRKELIPYDGLVYNLHVEEDESYSLLNATVHNCFASDSNGFFRRSLIESCVTKEPISPVTSPGEFVRFQATTRGSPDGHYVYGIDPASERDRFSIVILEVHPTHRRIVYCWTTTNQEHKERVQAKATRVQDFYGYCARKIRDLMKVFPCDHIALDSQGGGVGVLEALQDPDKMDEGEQPILPIAVDHPLSDGKERESDHQSGLHIIEVVNFAKAEWVADANHGMRKDFEDRALLFPEYDAGMLAIAMEDDQRNRREFDTLEDAVMEVEKIKEELSTIVHTQTGSTLRDHWDTPEVKLAGSRKGRLRKDRYSALLMANSAARRLSRRQTDPEFLPLGGFVQHSNYAPQPSRSGQMYLSAPDWFASGLKDERDSFGWAVNRHGVGD